MSFQKPKQTSDNKFRAFLLFFYFLAFCWSQLEPNSQPLFSACHFKSPNRLPITNSILFPPLSSPISASSMSDSDSNPNFLLSILPSSSDSDSETNAERTSINTDKIDQHHLSSINATISIRQLTSLGLSFQLWPAASTLVSLFNLTPSLLLQNPSSPLRILELGSGTGLVGIASACLLGANVVLTDLPHVVENLRFNVELNEEVVRSNGGSVCVKQLRWGDEGDANDVSENEDAFDLVLGTDVVYYEELIEPLIKTLEVFVKGKTSFVMAHLKRWKKRDAIFFRKAGKKFSVEVLHKDPPLPEWRSGVTVYRFTVKKGK